MSSARLTCRSAWLTPLSVSHEQAACVFGNRSLSSPEDALSRGAGGAGGVSAAFESVRLANRRTRTASAGRASAVVCAFRA